METRKTVDAVDSSATKATGGTWFSRMAKRISHYAGSSGMFLLALSFIVVWAVTGPLFHFSDTWQLVINTATTIITFLMVFLIQNTQNRDSCAVQVKLDELIKSMRLADNALLDLEELEEDEITEKKATYVQLAAEKRAKEDALEQIGSANR